MKHLPLNHSTNIKSFGISPIGGAQEAFLKMLSLVGAPSIGIVANYPHPCLL